MPNFQAQPTSYPIVSLFVNDRWSMLFVCCYRVSVVLRVQIVFRRIRGIVSPVLLSNRLSDFDNWLAPHPSCISLGRGRSCKPPNVEHAMQILNSSLF